MPPAPSPISKRLADPATSTLVSGCLVVTLPEEIADTLQALQDYVLERIGATGVHRVVFELSAVQIIDRTEFAGLRALAQMSALLGARTVLVGLAPGIVAWVLNGDIDTTGLQFKRDLGEALVHLGARGGRGPR